MRTCEDSFNLTKMYEGYGKNDFCTVVKLMETSRKVWIDFDESGIRTSLRY